MCDNVLMQEEEPYAGWCRSTHNFVGKNTVIYTFFGVKSVQNTGFCNVFNALASKNLSTYRYLQCFFIFVRFSIAGKLPK